MRAAIRREIADGTFVDYSDKCGLTLLAVAALNGHVEAVELLVQAGAHVDRLAGYTPVPSVFSGALQQARGAKGADQSKSQR